MIEKWAGPVVSAIKVQPMATVLLVINLSIFGLIYLSVQKNADRHAAQLTQLIEHCKPR